MTRKASKQKALLLSSLNETLSLSELETLLSTPLDTKTYDPSKFQDDGSERVTPMQAITYAAPVLTGMTKLAVIFCLGPRSEERVDELATFYSSLSDKSISSLGLSHSSLLASQLSTPPRNILLEAFSLKAPPSILIISRFFLSSPSFTSSFFRSTFLKENLKGAWIDGGQYSDPLSLSHPYDPITTFLKPLRSSPLWKGQKLFNFAVDLGMNAPASTREGGSEEEEERVRRIIESIDCEIPRERVAGSRTFAARNQAAGAGAGVMQETVGTGKKE